MKNVWLSLSIYEAKVSGKVTLKLYGYWLIYNTSTIKTEDF